jgi:hypothetical protein
VSNQPNDFKVKKGDFSKWNFCRAGALPMRAGGLEAMLVERGLQVMNVDVVGDAYSIASNYLRKSGAIADTFATDERLLEIIVTMFQRGEFNRLRLANKAIAKFEADLAKASRPVTSLSA